MITVGSGVAAVVTVVVVPTGVVTVGVTVGDPPVVPVVPCKGFRTTNAPAATTRITTISAAIMIPRGFFDAGLISGTGGNAGGTGAGASGAGVPGAAGVIAASPPGGDTGTECSVATAGVSTTGGVTGSVNISFPIRGAGSVLGTESAINGSIE